jgi:catechol 2,3-dioxygenase-like lactoylglutathione lyase family enzyme
MQRTMSDMADRRAFRMGRLDHVHIRVPDRAEAAAWYGKHLGFEPVEQYAFWATGFEGGPLQISADGGRTMLALFQAGEGHPMVAQETGVAFSVDAEAFISFARSLPGEISGPSGRPLVPNDLIDFDMCWAQLLRVRPDQGRSHRARCDHRGALLATGAVRRACRKQMTRLRMPALA